MTTATETKDTKAFAINEVVQKATDKVTDTIKTYTDKVTGTAKEYNEKVTDKVKEYNEKVTDKVKQYNDKVTDKVKEYHEKYLEKHIENGKDFVEDKIKMVNEKIDETVENGKKLVRKIPMANKIEETAKNVYDAVPGFVNLPSKKDIDKLSAEMKALDKKLDAVSKKL